MRMPTVLENVIIHVTNACSSQCPYCYACSDSKSFHHVDVNKVFKMVDLLADARVPHISLLGGDPALHPHIVEIGQYIKEKGISPSIMSNTMTLPAEPSKVVQIFDLFETSIHGSDAETHDSFSKNQGVYNELINNLKILSDLNARIGIAINIIPQNINMIFDMINVLVNDFKLKISYVILQRIVPFGRADGINEFKLSIQDVDMALSQTMRIRESLGINILVEDPFPLCKIRPEYRGIMHPCEWGFTKAALNANGDLSRCGADTRYLLGNIFETPITEIWENSPILKSFRRKDYLPDSCHSCSMFEQCGGGCAVSNKPVNDAGPDYLMIT